MSQLPVRIIKVGGSLFDLPDLAERIRNWLAVQSPAHHVLIAGGGALVEQIRSWHRMRPMNEEQAHWICLELMSITARLLQTTLPDIPLVKRDSELRERLVKPGDTIFDPTNWLRHDEPNLPGKPVPASWDITSDSIAARIASVLQADELVLLKSTLPVDGGDLEQLAASGYVDAAFPKFAAKLTTLRFVNLRDTGSLLVSRTQNQA